MQPTGVTPSMSRLISFCLYGTSAMYQQGAIQNARLAKSIYPGWSCRFYISQEIPNQIIEQLKALGAQVITMQRTSQVDGMFWRFLPASEPDLKALIVRDVDSRLSLREAAAVNQWLNSNKDFHIMRDHPGHQAAIMGGMWGIKGGVIKNMSARISRWQNKRRHENLLTFEKKGLDQTFLAEDIYPLITQSCMIHSSFAVLEGETVEPFPLSRLNGEFIGQVYNEYEQTLPHHLEALRRAEMS